MNVNAERCPTRIVSLKIGIQIAVGFFCCIWPVSENTNNIDIKFRLSRILVKLHILVARVGHVACYLKIQK